MISMLIVTKIVLFRLSCFHDREKPKSESKSNSDKSMKTHSQGQKNKWSSCYKVTGHVVNNRYKPYSKRSPCSWHLAPFENQRRICELVATLTVDGTIFFPQHFLRICKGLFSLFFLTTLSVQLITIALKKAITRGTFCYYKSPFFLLILVSLKLQTNNVFQGATSKTFITGRRLIPW